MRENIHRTVAVILASLFHRPPTSQVILAPECGGNHRIRLFSGELNCRAANYCWPDIAVTQNDRVRAILEIEQTGIVSPAKIAGKLLPVSMSTRLRNEEVGAEPILLSPEITFVQIVNTASFQPTSRKLLQYHNFESDTRKLLPLGYVVRYFLIAVAAEEVPPFHTAKYDRLLDAINDSLMQ